MKNKGVIVAVVAVLAIAGGTFALTRSSDKPADSTSATTPTSSTITYTNDGFSPVSLTVKAGTTVTIKNDSSRSLQFSSNPHPDHTNEPELNLDNLSPGKSTTFQASEPGSYGFHNHLNEDHTGTLIVE